MNDEKRAESGTRWLNSTVLGIGLASLFSDVGHEMATTAMPALLAMLRHSPAALGLSKGWPTGFRAYVKLFRVCTAIDCGGESRWR